MKNYREFCKQATNQVEETLNYLKKVGALSDLTEDLLDNLKENYEVENHWGYVDCSKAPTLHDDLNADLDKIAKKLIVTGFLDTIFELDHELAERYREEELTNDLFELLRIYDYMDELGEVNRLKHLKKGK